MKGLCFMDEGSRQAAQGEKFPYRPRVAGWELTLACNMNCIHCGSSAGHPRPDELRVDEGLDLIGQMVDLGLEMITLSGGEPLMHPAWDVYARRLSEGGVKTQMITNALLLEKSAQKMKDSGIKTFGISLDGMEETHNFIRNNPKSFQMALRGVKAAHEAGLTVGVVTHVSGANRDELEAMYQLFQEIGIKFWQIQVVFKMGRMKEHQDYAVEPEDLPGIAHFIYEKRKLGGLPNVFPGDNLGYYGCEPIFDKEWKGCFAGRHLMGIDADGTIKGCLSLPREFAEGNVRTEPLRQIWEDPNRFRYNRYFNPDMLEGHCKGCPKGDPCRAGCTITAYAATGNKFDNPYCLYRVERETGRGQNC